MTDLLSIETENQNPTPFTEEESSGEPIILEASDADAVFDDSVSEFSDVIMEESPENAPAYEDGAREPSLFRTAKDSRLNAFRRERPSR